MTFNPLKEKGIHPEKQLRMWHDIAHRHFNKTEVDCYTRTRQILMNGIEVEKEYVSDILVNEIDKRLGMDKDYTTVKKLPEDWPSYEVQETVNEEGSPTERTIQLISTLKDRDLVLASDALIKEVPKLLQKALEDVQVPDTVSVEDYKEMNEYQFEF